MYEDIQIHILVYIHAAAENIHIYMNIYRLQLREPLNRLQYRRLRQRHRPRLLQRHRPGLLRSRLPHRRLLQEKLKLRRR
jgi:hypothetical protein